MAILELDKIIIKKQIVGINCTNCGGDLQPISKKSLIHIFFPELPWGLKNQNVTDVKIVKKNIPYYK